MILYADTVTRSITRAMAETERRRKLQEQYNREMQITPETVKSQIKDILGSIYEADYFTAATVAEESAEYAPSEELIAALEAEMREAARVLDFERAAHLRDRMKAAREQALKVRLKESAPKPVASPKTRRRPARRR